MNVLKDHFSPKPIVIAERFRFHNRCQHETETVAQYVAILKRLSEYCEFGTHLQDALRDRFVCGLKTESIQKRLLTEAALTFQKAVEIAVSMETAARESQQLSNSLKVNALSLQEKGGNKCYRYGRTNHNERDCYFKDQLCHNCGNKGHISRVCRIKGKHTTDNAKSKWRKNVQQKKKVHQMDVKDSSSDDTTDTELALHVMTKKEELSHICLRPEVEGKILEMELDTGAAVSLISRELYNAQLAHKPLCTTDVILKTYTGEVVSPVGVIKVKVKLNKQKVKLPLYVVEGSAPPLFGREWLKKIRLNWREIKSVNKDALQTVLSKHKNVFRKGLGLLKGIEATVSLKPQSQPRFCQARNVPYALKPKVEAEINRLLELGVISSVTCSDWATPIVPVVKKKWGCEDLWRF